MGTFGYLDTLHSLLNVSSYHGSYWSVSRSVLLLLEYGHGGVSVHIPIVSRSGRLCGGVAACFYWSIVTEV